MTLGLVFHSNTVINCHKVISALSQGHNYVKYHNTYYIPFKCLSINHNNRIINGKFAYPAWNVFHRSILSNGVQFNYSYVRGKDIIFEFQPSSFKNYHIYCNNRIYVNSIRAAPLLLCNMSYLLFNIDTVVAEPLICRELI